MRTFSVAILTILWSLFLSAQSVQIPKEITASFTKLHPKAKDVKWGKEKDGYEASFKEEKAKYSVTMTKDGTLLETETDIEISALPTAVASFIDNTYPGSQIVEAAKIVDAKNVVTYEAEIKNKKVHGDLIFDEKGTLLKKELKNEKKEKHDHKKKHEKDENK